VVAQPAIDARRVFYGLALLAVISLSAFLYLTQACHVARQVDDMTLLEQQIQQLKQQNNALLLQISQHEKLPLLRQQAQLLGFGPPERIEYLVVTVNEEGLPLQAGAPADAQASVKATLSTARPASLHPSGLLQQAIGQFTGWTRLGTVQAQKPGS
jgi:hypothetical protein